MLKINNTLKPRLSRCLTTPLSSSSNQAEDADAALQHILRPERMAVMNIEPDGTAVEEDEEEETEE